MSNLDPTHVPPAAASPEAVPGSQDAATAHRPPDDAEEVYYEGSPLLRGYIGKGFLWILAGLALIALAVVAAIRHWPYFHWWGYLALVVIGLVLIIIPIVRSKTIRYRVSNYRIDFERGLLSKDIDTLELWHVEDIRFHQSLIDRILGVGNITVLSRDENMPSLVMHDVPQSRQLFEQLKQRIIAVKRSRGVIKMDPG